jgi:peptidoglycan/LPS O-acetylase OafA/YrhL
MEDRMSAERPRTPAGAQPGRKHVPALDGLRGVAVLLVFFLHYGGGAQSGNRLVHGVGQAEKAGWTGVTLFFLLSGFLITGILWDSKGVQHWWRNFYVRRALRIMPLYYGALLLVLLVATFNGTLGRALHGVWVQALYLQTFPYFFAQRWHVPPPLFLEHFWTLAIEEQFYLLWPFVLWLVPGRRAAAWICLGVFAASFAYRASSMAVYSPLTGDFLLLTRSGEFALGGWLALAYRGPAWERLRPWLGPVGAFAALLFVALTVRHDFAMSTPLNFALALAAISVAYTALIGVALRPGLVQRCASVGWLRWVGRISFGIYVYHLLLRQMFEWIAARLAHGTQGNLYLFLRLVVALASTLLIAAASYYLYEKKFLRFKRYFQADVRAAQDTTKTRSRG